jgi:hypothetical protein
MHTLPLALSLDVAEGNYTWTEGQFSPRVRWLLSDPRYKLANWTKPALHSRKSS